MNSWLQSVKSQQHSGTLNNIHQGHQLATPHMENSVLTCSTWGFLANEILATEWEAIESSCPFTSPSSTSTKPGSRREISITVAYKIQIPKKPSLCKIRQDSFADKPASLSEKPDLKLKKNC